jgi:hypothetical protein
MARSERFIEEKVRMSERPPDADIHADETLTARERR